MRARAVVVFCLLGAGACAAETEPVLPPLTPEASYPLFSSPDPSEQADAPADRRARLTLQKILRGAGSGKEAVCGWVAPAHAEERFGGPCAAWVAGLAPEERAMLRKVRVSASAEGAGARERIVDPADLVWPAGEPGSLPAAPYVLRLKGKRWVLVG